MYSRFRLKLNFKHSRSLRLSDNMVSVTNLVLQKIEDLLNIRSQFEFLSESNLFESPLHLLQSTDCASRWRERVRQLCNHHFSHWDTHNQHLVDLFMMRMVLNVCCKCVNHSGQGVTVATYDQDWVVWCDKIAQTTLLWLRDVSSIANDGVGVSLSLQRTLESAISSVLSLNWMDATRHLVRGWARREELRFNVENLCKMIQFSPMRFAAYELACCISRASDDESSAKACFTGAQTLCCLR